MALLALPVLYACSGFALLRAAVEISSASLARRWDEILRGDQRGVAEVRRAVRAVTSYRPRMATRCPPFGITAGMGVARFTDRAQDAPVRLGPSMRKSVRLERGWVTALTASRTGGQRRCAV
ncbi:hypothetical protein AV521_29615 [Streptomyces sp. IMTB 2501]|uniref:lantibiotic dehydratase n=1 Tax=Streptomyces sp. IMTB 2501 TaxID=1776340 RepID=UPI00096EB12C|nr:lantibiotic dehydratase [Streptomyces sp. IMTB 2501]OLZ65944.1 hypothetical protein AV521_29615 [Streptomyces sp. IMTB 2501]